MSTVRNIAAYVPEMARKRPNAQAVVMPAGRDSDGRRLYKHLTFAQLNDDSDLLAAGLLAAGFKRGERCALMVKPSLDFFALMFALFKAGIVPVLIDPGIGFGPLKLCLGEATPRGFIGIPLAHVARILGGWARETIEIKVCAGAPRIPGTISLRDIRELGMQAAAFTPAEPEPLETAAILFTSGSTGPPKGVVYTHETFNAQVEMIRDNFAIEPGEIDLPTFPPFALFDPALGMTAVIPDMDARKPARANPERLYEAIEDFGVTNVFGSPALLDTLSRHAVASGKKLPTIRRVISAGAPARIATLERMGEVLAEGVQVFTPYGATESLPVCIIGSNEVLATADQTAAGAGICVGKPAPGITVRIIGIDDGPVALLREDMLLPAGETGEIVVEGPPVTRSYFKREAATGLAKISAGEGRILHRMGDLGYLDDEGRLWFCGRKRQRVVTTGGVLFTIPCERVFDAHPAVKRTALVGVGEPGAARPVICVELETGTGDWNSVVRGLRELGAAVDHTRGIKHFLRHPSFPVDIRHNAKIGREKLARWADARLR